MDNHELTRSHYEALIRAIKPICPKCLDMNPSIFDWRAVKWARSYPNLNPLRVVYGARNRCMSCAIIIAAFNSIGLNLHDMHATQPLALYHEDRNASLIALAVLEESCSVVEFYTVDGECSPDSMFLLNYTSSHGSREQHVAVQLTAFPM